MRGQTEVAALAAELYMVLARAILDNAESWRAERKALRRAVAETAPTVAGRLEKGLRQACQGALAPLLALGREILSDLGGDKRTYSGRY